MKAAPQHKNCPVCGKCLDINTYIPALPGDDSKKPIKEIEPYDVTFCFECRTVLVFNQALNIVTPDEDMLYEITHDPDFHRFIGQIDQARKNKPNLN